MASEPIALTKIATSTWRASFVRARHVDTAVIRPAMTYGSTTWHFPAEAGEKDKSAEIKLCVMQNRYAYAE